MSRDLKMVAEYKKKEFDRLKDLTLNLMSIVELGLNPSSQSRNPYSGNEEIWIPTSNEIRSLNLTLLELRANILTSEEKESLNEEA